MPRVLSQDLREGMVAVVEAIGTYHRALKIALGYLPCVTLNPGRSRRFSDEKAPWLHCLRRCLCNAVLTSVVANDFCAQEISI